MILSWIRCPLQLIPKHFIHIVTDFFIFRHIRSLIRNLERTRPVSDISKSLFNVLPDKSTVVWRLDEPAHPFWLPMNPEEYEAPVDYMADAICSSVATVEQLQKTPSTMERNQDDTSILEAVTSNEPSDGSNTGGTTSNELACWAPLLNGRLCPRRDPGGRCPIHGRIVRRDKVSGRPVDLRDREVLHAEITKSQREKSEGWCLFPVNNRLTHR
ncbi:uncharacterized protein DEA37_0009700 [Paragonimus westermani]|uniref:UV-stimulated scaffold protein A C-terminal domain-containing protein n=1 Tax=Paragonimus westermani TaxID=34504 RepID=A0A5J4NCF3_9TREM|nr:uncharacterized protein DEA37_0009700 [Paragonimus westermani]